jgi:murein DD-endopeptidase MepM/ murein hydrolase activator NlpD
VELRFDHDRSSALEPRDTGESLSLRLASLNADDDRVQAEQLGSVAALAAEAARSASKLRAALAQAGLSPARLASSAHPPETDEPMGGPYVPVRLDVEGSPLQTRFDDLQDQIAEDQKLASALPYLPLRQPLQGRLETTSPFGLRLDPFLGRLALHPGTDLRAAIGAPVLATAAGKVTNASYDGGYGNMVEIDHGDGLSTRYGHLSAILVRVGQTVGAGEEIGRVGTTGRSTGPHLHYEVRIDGQPVDPMRFVRAGETLIASQ